MSASAPDLTAGALEEDPGALSGDQARFIADLLGANARWSASIHTAALDGQERSSNEWASRYLRLIQRLDQLLRTTAHYEMKTELFDQLENLVAAQSFWPEHAAEQIERYHQRLEKDKAVETTTG